MNSPRTINEARTLANINSRAQSLLSQGYTINPAGSDGISLYGIYKPGNTDTKPDYAVITYPFRRCTCPIFPKFDTCKHILAADAYEEEQEMRAAAERDGVEW